MENLIKALSSSNEADRIYAAQDIGETGDSDLAQPLLEQLPGESSQAVRDAIVFALKNLPCSGVYEGLFKLFRSADPYLRNAAIDIFGSEGNRAVSFLASHRGHQDGEVRKLILDALFATTAPDAMTPIRLCLKDPSVNVRITAVEYLGRMEDRESLDQMLTLLREEDEPMLKIAILETIYQIAARQRDIADALEALIPDKNYADMDLLYFPQAIRLAVKTGDPRAVADLIEAISKPDVYAEDIVHALEHAAWQFPDMLRSEPVQIIVKKIMAAGDEHIRNLCNTLLRQN
jgi:HEAT repeat protein